MIGLSEEKFLALYRVNKEDLNIVFLDILNNYLSLMLP